MKFIKKSALTLVLFIYCTIVFSNPAVFFSGGLKCEIMESDTTYVEVSWSYMHNLENINYSLVIPAYVEDGGIRYTVHGIKNRGFEECNFIHCITIEEGVKEMGDNAFSNCTFLESVQIPASMESVGTAPFSGCISLATVQVDMENKKYDSRDSCNAIIRSMDDELIVGCKTTRIPPSVKSIGTKAFHNCAFLQKMIFPEGIESISTSAFEGCICLAQISFPESLRELDGESFSGCSSLVEVHIPKGVKNISYNPFTNCPSLHKIVVDMKNEVYSSYNNSNAIVEIRSQKLVSGCFNTTIPNSVVQIETFSFQGCKKLTSIHIPANVQKIEHGALANCTALSSISVDPKNETYESKNNCIVEKGTKTLVCGCRASDIPTDIQYIDVWAFRGMEIPERLILPHNIKMIRRGAFYGCTGLVHLFLPKDLIIEPQAFEGCRSLVMVVMEKGMEKVNPAIFRYCTALSSVHLPDGMKVIHDEAFYGCSSLARITLPGSLQKISETAFGGCPCQRLVSTFISTDNKN